MLFVVLIHYSLSVDEMWYPSPQQTPTVVNRSAHSSCQTLGRTYSKGFGEKGERNQTRHAAHLELFKSISITTDEPLSRLHTVDCIITTLLCLNCSITAATWDSRDKRELQTDATHAAKTYRQISYAEAGTYCWLLICKIFLSG